MNRNVFKHLRKNILNLSTITEEVDNQIIVYRIECLGFRKMISMPSEFHSGKLYEGLLVDKLVEDADFLIKLEQIENRNHNLKTLLD